MDRKFNLDGTVKNTNKAIRVMKELYKEIDPVGYEELEKEMKLEKQKKKNKNKK